MRWREGRRSTNVEDRRGGGGVARRGVQVGGGAILLIAVVTMLLGGDPAKVVDMMGQAQRQMPQPPRGGGGAPADPNDEGAQFVSVVLADLEDTWMRELPRQTRVDYRPPKLVLFSDMVQSACGYNSAAVGPFYCPGDDQVYIDLVFFRELQTKFGAPGDFAQAYVIAHEVGHHIQNLLGISEQVHRERSRRSKAEGNALSVRQELQADCIAGVWGHHAAQRGLLETGDVEEGLRAASAIGDDTLQRRSGGSVSPESWTHGSSDQRVRWFRLGLDTGDISRCDTFKADRL